MRAHEVRPLNSPLLTCRHLRKEKEFRPRITQQLVLRLLCSRWWGYSLLAHQPILKQAELSSGWFQVDRYPYFVPWGGGGRQDRNCQRHRRLWCASGGRIPISVASHPSIPQSFNSRIRASEALLDFKHSAHGNAHPLHIWWQETAVISRYPGS